MKVWLAQEIYYYEGATPIGVYKTETKAMQACLDYWIEEHSGESLEWHNGQAQGRNEHHIFTITVFELE